MRAYRIATLLAAVLALSACGGSDDTADVDASLGTEDASAACAPPSSPDDYGTTEGRKLAPFTLNRCDGTPYSFYGESEGYCGASFTVLTMAAGWCVPCQMEAALIQSEVADAFADRGVRVVQVLIQDAAYNPPSPQFCQQWVDTYGLEFPELMDPTQITQRYFPMGALPATLIVDSTGTIVYREYGTSANLVTLTSKLEQLTAE